MFWLTDPVWDCQHIHVPHIFTSCRHVVWSLWDSCVLWVLFFSIIGCGGFAVYAMLVECLVRAHAAKDANAPLTICHTHQALSWHAVAVATATATAVDARPTNKQEKVHTSGVVGSTSSTGGGVCLCQQETWLCCRRCWGEIGCLCNKYICIMYTQTQTTPTTRRSGMQIYATVWAYFGGGVTFERLTVLSVCRAFWRRRWRQLRCTHILYCIE